jgi:hypothetical protein
MGQYLMTLSYQNLESSVREGFSYRAVHWDHIVFRNKNTSFVIVAGSLYGSAMGSSTNGK